MTFKVWFLKFFLIFKIYYFFNGTWLKLCVVNLQIRQVYCICGACLMWGYFVKSEKNSISFFFFFFWSGTWGFNSGLYHLSHIPVPFGFTRFQIGSHGFCPAFYSFIYYFSILGLELRAYSLSHSTSPFLWWVFSRYNFENYLPGVDFQPWSSWSARITAWATSALLLPKILSRNTLRLWSSYLRLPVALYMCLKVFSSLGLFSKLQNYTSSCQSLPSSLSQPSLTRLVFLQWLPLWRVSPYT
jgi:hypothetical protein